MPIITANDAMELDGHLSRLFEPRRRTAQRLPSCSRKSSTSELRPAG